MALNTAKTFSMEIEKIANEKNITHMEAVLDYCHRQEIEPDTVGRLISKSLKEKIEANARELELSPSTGATSSMTYELKVPNGTYTANNLFVLFFTVVKHRLHHLIKDRKFMD